MEWLHVVPTKDLIEHDDSITCICNPRLDWDEMIAIHHSLDGREAKETKGD